MAPLRHSLKYMDIEVPVSAPISKYNLDVDLLRDIVLFGAFYPNYFVKHHNQGLGFNTRKTKEIGFRGSV